MTRKRFRWARALGTVVAGAALVVALAPSVPAQSTGTNVLQVGALLSLTGGGSSLGNTSRASLEVATAQWNRRLQHAGTQVKLDVVDTGQDPARAVAGFQQLAAEGVRVIIGPQTSSEVAAIAPLANAQGVLLVSQGSTASSLAMPNNNVFRFVPNDHVEGRTSTDLIAKQGIRAVVPLWRDDRGNVGLVSSVRAAASASGIQVTPGFPYEPSTTDYGPALQAVAAQVATATQQFGAAHVGVYYAGFEESANVFAAAHAMPGLSGVRWYGADSSAQATQLIDNTNSASFAVAVKGWPSPLIALPAGNETRYAALIRQIKQVAHATPDAFGLAAYDGLNVAVQTLRNAAPGVSGPALRAAFASAANGYHGVTGTIQLDPNGDRASAPYAYWSICRVGGKKPAWVRSGTWTPNTSDPTGPGKTSGGNCPG